MNTFTKTLALAVLAMGIGAAAPATAGCTGCDVDVIDWWVDGYLDGRDDTGFGQQFQAGQSVFVSVDGYDSDGNSVDMDFQIWNGNQQVANADLVGSEGVDFYVEPNGDYYVVVKNASYYGGHWEMYFEVTTYR